MRIRKGVPRYSRVKAVGGCVSNAIHCFAPMVPIQGNVRGAGSTSDTVRVPTTRSQPEAVTAKRAGAAVRGAPPFTMQVILAHPVGVPTAACTMLPREMNTHLRSIVVSAKEIGFGAANVRTYSGTAPGITARVPATAVMIRRKAGDIICRLVEPELAWLAAPMSKLAHLTVTLKMAAEI